jgi:hypothetical protein
MNFFTRPPFNPLDLLPSPPLYYPRHLQLLLLNVNLLKIDSERRARFQGGWHPNYDSNKGNKSAAPKSNFHSFNGPFSNDRRQGN